MGDRTSGIKAFDCLKDNWDQNTFYFWERYESNGALGKHNATPEMVQFMEKVAPLLEKPVGMAMYEYRQGQLGSVCQQEGPKGEGGLDDATGASGAAGGAGLKQTSGTVDLTQINDDEDEERIMADFTTHMTKGVGSLLSGLQNIFSGAAGAKK